MKLHQYLVVFLLGLTFSCAAPEGNNQEENLPYFDMKGFLDTQLGKLDGTTVSKVSRIDGQEQASESTYSQKDWREELDVFYQADINMPSLFQSYTTEIKYAYLLHKLKPEAKGKVQEIIVRDYQTSPSAVTFKIREENMFYSSVIIGELYINQNSGLVDHYNIETTQKVLFLKPTNIKIQGVVK